MLHLISFILAFLSLFTFLTEQSQWNGSAECVAWPWWWRLKNEWSPSEWSKLFRWIKWDKVFCSQQTRRSLARLTFSTYPPRRSLYLSLSSPPSSWVLTLLFTRCLYKLMFHLPSLIRQATSSFPLPLLTLFLRSAFFVSPAFHWRSDIYSIWSFTRSSAATLINWV